MTALARLCVLSATGVAVMLALWIIVVLLTAPLGDE